MSVMENVFLFAGHCCDIYALKGEEVKGEDGGKKKIQHNCGTKREEKTEQQLQRFKNLLTSI